MTTTKMMSIIAMEVSYQRKPSFNEETTGAGHENSSPYITKPTRQSFIRYRINDTDVWKEAETISMQPKQTGKYKNWMNACVVGEEPVCVNLYHCDFICFTKVLYCH